MRLIPFLSDPALAAPLLPLLSLVLSTLPASSGLSTGLPVVAPSEDAARRNAFQIFNAVASAMRQWGSSVHHNGLSYFLATVPQDSIFYHGTNKPERPEGFEWLAFEVEHAQVFARSRNASWGGIRPPPGEGRPGEPGGPGGRRPRPPPPSAPGGAQHPLNLHDDVHDDDDEEQEPLHPALRFRQPPPGHDPDQPVRGYLQTYRATRPLRLLYLDGMAAGKAEFGTLDSQDYILLDWPVEKHLPSDGKHGMYDEFTRAAELCQLADEWSSSGEGSRIDGFVRMEAGFEIIHCHFEEGGGLDLVSATASPFRNETGFVEESVWGFEWLRACTLRYNGLPAGRIDVDWSSMVSAFFYPINLTNPDPSRPELPRVLNTTRPERQAIRSRVSEVVASRRPQSQTSSSFNWQGTVDLIVTRYADRLELLASSDAADADALSTLQRIREQVGFLLLPFIDFSSSADAKPSRQKCGRRYLEAALAARDNDGGGENNNWTVEDGMILAAVEAVNQRICDALVDVWEDVMTPVDGEEEGTEPETERRRESGEKAMGVVKTLVDDLAWPGWKDCGRCKSRDELCFIAMFPAGTWDDHFEPRCQDAASLVGTRRDSYWRHGRFSPQDG